MQQYKFRGKRKDNGEWVYGLLVMGVFKDTMIQVNDDDYYSCVVVIPETVCLWTGWKDKDGKDIYEGDKLKGWMGEQDMIDRSPITSTVILKPGGFQVFSKPMSHCILGRFTWIDPGYHGRRDVYRVIEDMEVIGNIHEVNPTSGKASINNMLDPNEKQAAEGQEATTETLESASQDNALGVDSEEGTTEG